MKETLEEAAEVYANKKGDIPTTELEDAIFKQGFIDGAKWMQKRSQSIVPFDAYNIEVFAIKPDEQGKLFAYIGYKISNGNFHFNVVPFTEPQQERRYSVEGMRSAWEDGRKFEYDHNGGEGGEFTGAESFEEWFEQFKKK